MNNNFSIIWGTRQLSARQIQTYVSSSIKYLRGLGLREGQRVAICEENSVEYIILLLALWQMKVVAAPINSKWPVKTVNAYAAQISAAHLFRGVDIKRLVCFDARHEVEVIQAPEFQMEQEVTIIATSGSSGEPKPAVHTWGNHLYSAKGLNEVIPLTVQDAWLLALPLYHVAGIGVLVRCLVSGSAVVLAANADIATAINRGKVTHVSLVPTQLQRLLSDAANHAALKKLKCILLGGSAIPTALVEQSLKLGLNIYLSYGLTEMSSTVAISHCHVNMSFPKSSAPSCRVFPKVIGNPERSYGARILLYRELKLAADGEILVRGETLFKGYIAGARLQLPLLGDGYFATGDLGQLDEQGCLMVLGRKDNMFISGGENIQPEEIEKVLLSIKGIDQAVVVAREDAEFGKRPVSFLKYTNAPLTEAQLIKHLEQELPRFKIPVAFYSWPQELISNSIKIARKDFLTRI